MHFFTCSVDYNIAELYIHYCNEHNLTCYTTYNSNTVYLEIWGTKEDLWLFKRWILKTLYRLEAQHG